MAKIVFWHILIGSVLLQLYFEMTRTKRETQFIVVGVVVVVVVVVVGGSRVSARAFCSRPCTKPCVLRVFCVLNVV